MIFDPRMPPFWAKTRPDKPTAEAKHRRRLSEFSEISRRAEFLAGLADKSPKEEEELEALRDDLAYLAGQGVGPESDPVGFDGASRAGGRDGNGNRWVSRRRPR